MKSILDTIQIALQMPGFDIAACIVLAILLMWGAKVVYRATGDIWRAWSYIRRYFLKLSLHNGIAILFISGIIYASREQISNGLQFIEQSYITPIYACSDTSAAVIAYERELQKHTTPEEFAAVVSETRRIAAGCGSSPLAFYEVYLSECGMNPYAINTDSVYLGGRFVRVDTVAVGIIQFTRAGVSGLTMESVPVTFRQVLDARNRHDIRFIMALTGQYIARASGGRSLARSCDVYTAIYMPAYVGAKDDTPLASAWSDKPQYYWQNVGLDGWKLTDAGKILHLPQYRDGKITISDLALCLAAKKARLIGAYN